MTRAIYSRVDSPGLGSDLVGIGADVDDMSITAKTHTIASLNVTTYGSRQGSYQFIDESTYVTHCNLPVCNK